MTHLVTRLLIIFREIQIANLYFIFFLQFLHNKDANMNMRYNMLSSFKQTIEYITNLGFQNASNFVIAQDNFILFL